MAVNITKHFGLRYIERIKQIKDKNERKVYYTKNQEKITEDANKMLEMSEFVWMGQLGDNITRKFFINGNIILVADTDETALITLYKTDYGFPEKANRAVAKELLEKLYELKIDLEQAKEEAEEQVDKVELEIENIDAELKSLRSQVNLLEVKKKAKAEERKGIMSMTKFVKEEVDKTAKLLCNSIEYRADVKEFEAGK
ncbi:hypothetical protein CON15_19625 [Bacillus cereus]|uniref:Uncharacterized protein n=1 Tax=Bacillus thuringiensis TaxID=1428 RepID=A0AB36VFJ0_BACTU|nr:MULTISPECIES: hypothetical protein [Bacillus cereus group]PDZ55752.1 hypothetical protein CON15_19625 [Bacillus cereus]PFO26172.1 hypothetical protein COJ78_29150 [Bacillus thuringiensis]PFS40372.1 hypothetical protein COK48_00580 [Bacillus thuringiensis]PFS58171.1 hypothetical protein COK64_17475 [Bacillus thuringiensis]PGZ04991.1 hypothetical protein COE48_05250 [Bacillus thuringiensis]